jgi:hypothetical protein
VKATASARVARAVATFGNIISICPIALETLGLFAMLAIAIAISTVAVPIPFVPVFEAAAISFPITAVKALAIVTRSDPSSTLIGWTSPVATMPPVMSSHGIPVTIHPHKFRPRLIGNNSHHARPRWRTDSDTDRYLSP